MTTTARKNAKLKARKTTFTRFAGVVIAIAAICGAIAAQANATEPIETFTTSSSTSQAGGHPDLETTFTLASPGEPESAENVTFNAPQGLFGNTNAVTKCTSVDFALDQCPSNSQVGLATINANYSGNSNYLLGTAPIYDLTPREGETARFSFITPILNIPIAIPVALRTAGDYGLRFTVSEISQLTPLAGAHLTFWGFPELGSHSEERFPKGSPGEPSGCSNMADTGCLAGIKTPSSLPPHPFTDNPSSCTETPLTTTLEVQTYQDPGHRSVETSGYSATTGCEKVTFKPVLQATPTTPETDAPSGLNLELTARQLEGFATAPSSIKSAVVTMPEGFTINPDAADGQTSCADIEAHFDSEGPAECPDNAKIGTFGISSPTLDEELTGSIYIGKPQPGNQYRLFLFASGMGINVKLTGSIRPDPVSGQVIAYFEGLPEVPFETFQLHLFSGERALMATPTACTSYSVEAGFFPWDDVLPDQRSNQSFSLKSGPHGSECPGQLRPFHPRLVAGTSTPAAGAFSDFHLKLDRDDGDQFLGDLTFKLPPGFTGDLRGISYCPEASIAAAAANSGLAEQGSGSCPASSQIGTTNVAAGPGSHPFHAVGKMYMAGPFKGAPLSVVAITPALAGPYDYGVVMVRVALHVDPETAQVFAASDTVPSIIGGIPIRMRSIQVNLERKDSSGNPNFTINPTNCEPFSVNSQGIGNQGTTVGFSSYFNVVNCGLLDFAPRMSVRLAGGRSKTNRSVNPQLQFDLVTRPGDANIKSLNVTLSNDFEIDQEHLGNLCSEKELANTKCAGRQQIGEATTTTPLLDQPLSGPVYAVSGSGGLPRLAFVLDGQVNLLPRAETKTVSGGRLQTTVPIVPDAPIGHFHLIVFGGKHGYLANTRDLCKRRPKIGIGYTAQNGTTSKEVVSVKVPCGSKARVKRHHR